jgi:hypothetical protein
MNFVRIEQKRDYKLFINILYINNYKYGDVQNFNEI